MGNTKKIMVVDDDEDIRDVIVFALENDDFEVLTAPHGKAALKLLTSMKKELPGLIIVDYLMPEMDGVTLIHEMKEKHPHDLGKIPIVLSSAMGEIDPSLEKFQGLILLHKPMDLEDLLKIARKACRE